ncbi:hypothetical protein BTVI_15667 [Pitangus sulphuratus]|nr:hypothetical protein BTVI_15667 [Pitangus sulphuratus]
MTLACQRGMGPTCLERQGNLWQQADHLDETGFKLKDFVGGVQTGNVHAIATKWGISQANRSRDKHFFSAFQDEKQMINHLKCMYTNAHILGNKHNKLELCAQSESYDIGITETWWNNSHHRRTMMDGYRLLHKGRQERKGGGIVLYAKKNFECIEVNYGDCGRPIECL